MMFCIEVGVSGRPMIQTAFDYGCQVADNIMAMKNRSLFNVGLITIIKFKQVIKYCVNKLDKWYVFFIPSCQNLLTPN